ncbi:MAG: CGNR zinc finger domain-containing protein [Candidatus Dormibacteria bacterium]
MISPLALSTRAAPGGLGLVQDFINSTELPGGWDELGDLEATVTWLRTHGLEFTPDEAQRRRLVEVREQLRELLSVNQGHPLSEATAARLGRMLSTPSLRARVDGDGVHLQAAGSGSDGLLGQILAALVRSTVDGTFRRLKVCRDETCQWTFYDSSKNGRGAWCGVRGCGARAKARAYRLRRRDLPEAGS